MPKEIKEIYQNPTTGDVTVEYSDDSTKKFNIADTVTYSSYSTDGITIYGVGKVFIPANPDDGTADQTALVQSVLNSCKPGQTAVLPPPVDDTNRFIRCGNIKIPSGVHLESAGAVPLRWNITFSTSLSQAYNSALVGIWFKQCKFRIEETGATGTLSSATSLSVTDSSKSWAPNQWVGWKVKITAGTGSAQSTTTKRIKSNDATTLTLFSAWGTTPDNTSQYLLFCDMSCVVFDRCFIDGTDEVTGGNPTTGDAVYIGQYGYDVKFTNGTQICNYTGWGINVVGNPDDTNNTGTPYLATGVFVTLSDSKIFNCGASAESGGIRLFGAPQDGGSLHMTNVLLDHCQRALLVDNSVSGNPSAYPALSGGWTVLGSNVRVELCGNYAGVESESIKIADKVGSCHIFGLWYSSNVTTSLYKNIWVRSGDVKFRGGRMSKGAATAYEIYCDPGITAEFDVKSMGTPYQIGAIKPARVSDSSSAGQIVNLRFRYTKTAGGITAQRLSGSGFGFGAGGTAGDAWNTATSADLTNGGATVTVGGTYDKIYYQLTAGGGQIRTQLEGRKVTRAVGASISEQTAGITNIVPDVKLLNGTTDFTVILKNASGTEINLNSTLTTGQYIDVTVTICAEMP